jgi:hypothetical protein
MDTTTTALSCFVRVACGFGGSDGLVVEHCLLESRLAIFEQPLRRVHDLLD